MTTILELFIIHKSIISNDNYISDEPQSSITDTVYSKSNIPRKLFCNFCMAQFVQTELGLDFLSQMDPNCRRIYSKGKEMVTI